MFVYTGFWRTASLMLGFLEIAPGFPLKLLGCSWVVASPKDYTYCLVIPVETALHFAMGNISELTWDKLIDAEVAKPTPETRERALLFLC